MPGKDRKCRFGAGDGGVLARCGCCVRQDPTTAWPGTATADFWA